jgi:hypothetical protein
MMEGSDGAGGFDNVPPLIYIAVYTKAEVHHANSQNFH